MHYGLVDPTSPPEDELAALRRRAYGPDADIGADPRAQARLADLEHQLSTREHGASAVARTRPPIGQATEVDDPATVATAHGASATPDAGDEAETGISATPAESAPSAKAPGRRRRTLPWMIATGAAVVATALGAMYVYAANEPDAVTEPLVEARLVALDEPPPGNVPPALSEEDLAYLAAVAETTEPVFVSHGGYGPLEVWSTTTRHNWQCLAVVFESSVWRFNCSVSSLDTVADVSVQESLLPTDAPGGPIPEWSDVRFVLHDDVVDVYIGRNADPSFAEAIASAGVLIKPSAEEIAAASDASLCQRGTSWAQVSAAANFASLQECAGSTGWAYVTGSVDDGEVHHGLLGAANEPEVFVLDDRFFVALESSPGVKGAPTAWLIDSVSGGQAELSWRDEPTTVSSRAQALVVSEGPESVSPLRVDRSASPALGLPRVVDGRDGTIRPLAVPDNTSAIFPSHISAKAGSGSGLHPTTSSASPTATTAVGHGPRSPSRHSCSRKPASWKRRPCTAPTLCPSRPMVIASP